MKNMSTFERVTWGLALCVATFAASWPYVLKTRPYHNVELIDTHRNGAFRYFMVDFTKGECELISVVFLGAQLGVQTNLTEKWEALDGYPDGDEPVWSRTAGRQQMRGRLEVGNEFYNIYEIRTRHVCDGDTVDRVFLRYDASKTGG